MGAAAAAVAIAERRMVEAFELAGATSAAAARTPDEVGVETSSLGWRRLTNRAVIREAEPGSGRYYLDREVWQAVRRTRMRLVAASAPAGLEPSKTPDVSTVSPITPTIHRGYAATWFALALAALVIYWLAVVRRLREAKPVQ